MRCAGALPSLASIFPHLPHLLHLPHRHTLNQTHRGGAHGAVRERVSFSVNTKGQKVGGKRLPHAPPCTLETIP